MPLLYQDSADLLLGVQVLVMCNDYPDQSPFHTLLLLSFDQDTF